MKLDYDEISPITKQKSVLVEKEGDTIYKICTQSGYVMNPNLKFGQEGFKRVGFLEETYTKFQEGEEVVDAWARIPTAVLRDRVVDKNGDVWLPAQQYGEYWCLHPTVAIKDGQNSRWGVSPIIMITVDASKPAEGLLERIVESIESRDFNDPKYSLVTLVPDPAGSTKVRYFFAEYEKARWYDNYQAAYEAFNKLENERE